MTTSYIQNLATPAKRFHGGTVGPALASRAVNTNPFVNLLARLRAILVEIDRRRRVEYENRKAMAHLESLTDAQLRDVGINRPDIERCVQLGREAI